MTTELAASASPLITPETVEPLPKYVYISVDMESTGSKPPWGDMVSLGACTLWLDDLDRMETFYVNLKPAYGRAEADTMQNFWAKWPERWQDTQSNQQLPNEAMQSFADWVKEVSGESTPIFMAWPSHFDFGWVDHYFKLYDIESPYGYKCLDQISFIAGLLKKPELVVGSRSKGTLDIPESWEGTNVTPHNALADAVAQRQGFIQTLKDTGVINA
jgi:DNA polymerase III epsilon subunit-like protein